MAEKREEEIRQIKLPAEQKRLKHEYSEPEFPPIKRQRSSAEIERNRETEPIDRRLQAPEIQRLHAEQERLRIEAERIWLEQEHHFAEQARLRSEAESTEPHRDEAKIRQFIAQQRPFEPKKQSADKEDFDQMTIPPRSPLSDDSAQPQRPTEIALKATEQTVSSGIIPQKTADFSFTYAQNHRTSRLLPVAALIFLMLGGTILGVLFLQTSKRQESNQTGLGETQTNQTVTSQTETNQTQSNQTVSTSLTSSPEPVAPSTPEINKVPLAPVSLNLETRPVDKPAPAAKRAAWSVKKPTRRLRKTSPKRKQSITIDDILNEQ